MTIKRKKAGSLSSKGCGLRFSYYARLLTAFPAFYCSTRVVAFKKTNNNFCSSVWPKMAETFLLLLLCMAFTTSSAASNPMVTFVGFLNDKDSMAFSALLQVDTTQFNANDGGLWLASEGPDQCFAQVYGLAKAEEDSSKAVLSLVLPVQQGHEARTLYLCHKAPGADSAWVALGPASRFHMPKVTVKHVLNQASDEYLIETLDDVDPQALALTSGYSRESRAFDLLAENATTADDAIARVVAIRLVSLAKDVSYSDDGFIEALEGEAVPLAIFGFGLTNDTEILLTSAVSEFGASCSKTHEFNIRTSSYKIVASADGTSAHVDIPSGDLPAIEGQDTFYICLRTNPTLRFTHQGSDESLGIRVYVLLLPIWVMVCFIIVLLCLSGLFSGLNLGLMALDQTELKIIQNTGSDNEKTYAKKIAPIRAHGNFLLCSLLLGNVLVNNTLTILLDTLTSGIVAVIGATMGIVIFGEIIPQALCSRHGLAVGAYTIGLTKLFMFITFPLSFPISKILDLILGAEIGTVYDKKKLIELLRITNDNNDLEKEEVDIVTGALVYKEKTVRSVMTKLEDCYMLPLKTILNFDTVSEIREQGYSRIPIFDGDRANIVHVLFAKDLMFIDPDDNMPVSMVCEFYNNDVNFVFQDTPLNVMFNEFKSGEKGHMAFVQDVNTSGEGDPFYETIGLITLEDIIEEIIQQEIVDETDVVLDNRSKKKRRRENFKSGTEGTTFHQMFGGETSKKISISPQLTLAVFQYLTTSIEPFKGYYMSEVVLKRLLTMDVYREVKIKKDSSGAKKVDQAEITLMEKGKPIDFFILIVEGKVEVNIGREELVFESGPFTYFGIQTLNQVIESPSSPMLAFRSEALKASATPSSAEPKLRKASTQQSIDVPSSVLANKRNSASAEVSRAASILPVFAAFIPDYTITAVSDVLYLKIKRTTYLRALKASMMGKKASNSGEINDRELENLLEKVNEDECMENELNMMLRTPQAHSPNASEQEEHEVTRVKVTSSGASTPTLAVRGDSMASKGVEDDTWDIKQNDFSLTSINSLSNGQIKDVKADDHSGAEASETRTMQEQQPS